MMIKTMKVSIISYSLLLVVLRLLLLGAKKTEEIMKIPVIRHKYKKPACIHEVHTITTNTTTITIVIG